MYEPLECVQRIPYPHTNIISLGTWRKYGCDELVEGANVLPELGDRFEIGDMFLFNGNNDQQHFTKHIKLKAHLADLKDAHDCSYGTLKWRKGCARFLCDLECRQNRLYGGYSNTISPELHSKCRNLVPCASDEGKAGRFVWFVWFLHIIGRPGSAEESGA